MHMLWMALQHAFAMFWATLWALVLGFCLSAVLQVFISKEQMTRAFGRSGWREVLLAIGFGAASSSCSYAAVAAGRSAFQKGAALIPVLAFMFAATNLVIELGTVLWLLMGWQFVLAEVIGAFVLIAVMWLLMRLTFLRTLEEEARVHAQEAVGEGECCHHDHEHGHEHSPASAQGTWTRVATAFWMDWQMLWKEIFGGFLIAGFLSAFVPPDWWRAFFLESGPPVLRLVENAAVGPLIAVASFVCSVGNIPLASLLWSHGISFGGVISFIYGDLIVIPIILIYWKYFGGRATLRITLILYLSMVLAGVVVDLLFAGLGLIPDHVPMAHAMAHGEVLWNYTTWLNLAAMIAALWLFLVRFSRRPAIS